MALGKKIITSVLLASSLAAAGCGSAGNDQGVSFTLLGFTLLSGDSAAGGRSCDFTKYDNTISIPIGESFESNTAAVETKRCFLVQNNMTNVAVRTERINLTYFIPGADRQPPTTSIPATVLVGTAQGTEAPGQGGSTGTGGDNDTADNTNQGIGSIGNQTGAPINMVPPEIRSWISLNRDSLPEAPFSLEISASVIGVTTAGDQLETNKAYYQAQIVNDLIINPPVVDDGDAVAEALLTGDATASDAELSAIIE